MREIKFRAWHIKRKKYYEVHHLHIGSIGIHENDWATCKAYDCIEQKDIYIQVQPNECIIEQFTGLHDKKNREIYHGDICKIKFDVEKVEDYVFAALSKKEIETGERIFLVESPLFNNQPELNCDDVEVIGNIHENPELLEGRE